MTYRGERSDKRPSEQARFFEVSKVRLAANGQVLDVLWGEVNSASGLNVGEDVLATAAEVIEAIYSGATVLVLFDTAGPRPGKRPLVIALQPEGGEHLAFDGPPIPGQCLADVNRLETPGTGLSGNRTTARPAHSRGRPPIHAVSKVRLDEDGRITAVLWGTVDPATNDWAAPEVVAPAAEAADALRAGHQVFALFPSTHGHLPDRQFAVANYDGTRTTIVLDGAATHEREVHHMDRLDAAQ